MRTAAEIVESVTREVLDTTPETTDAIDRRAAEFTHVALAAPQGTLQRDVAAVVATKLFRLSTSLSMQRFRL